MLLGWWLVVGATAGVAACGDDGDDEMPSGLVCRNGMFYLDGEEFTDCAACPTPNDCGFMTSTNYGPSGNVTSQRVVANCAGQSAVMQDGVCQ